MEHNNEYFVVDPLVSFDIGHTHMQMGLQFQFSTHEIKVILSIV